MEQKDLNWWIEKIRKNEIHISPDKVKKIRNLFVRKLLEDQNKLNKIIESFGLFSNSLGIPGTELFPITIDIINRERMPGDLKWYGYGEALCVVYYGISPELENFVSLVLWPHESKNPEYINASRRAYKEIYNLVVNDPFHRNIIKISGGYRLTLPNEIRPYRSKISSLHKPKAIYDWVYVPYLKEVGDTILSHKSPLNFTRAFIRMLDNSLMAKYINFKTTVGEFIGKRKNIGKFKLIYISQKKRKLYTVFIHHTVLGKFNEFRKGDLVALLIGEVIDHKLQSTIMDVEKIKSIDIFSHILIYKLYNLYLEKKRLLLMSWKEFEHLYKKFCNLVARFCKGIYDVSSTFYDLNTFFEMQLKFFFRNINGNLYYVPFILNGIKTEDIKLFDRRLHENKKKLFDERLVFDERGYIRRDLQEIRRKYDMLRFLMEIKSFIYKSESVI